MSDTPPGPQSPINPLPPVVWALALPIIVLEAIFQLGALGVIGGQNGIGLRLDFLSRMVFLPEQLVWMIESHRWPLQELSRLVTYAFVHVSLMHAAFVVVFILALGKFVGSIFHPAALVALFLGSSIAAALIYTLAVANVPLLRAETGQMVPLAGGYPGAFGLIGAFTFILWVRIGAAGGNSASAFQLIGLMMVVRLVFGIFFGSSPDWVADISGFVVGFTLSFLLVPGGPSKLLAHLRDR